MLGFASSAQPTAVNSKVTTRVGWAELAKPNISKPAQPQPATKRPPRSQACYYKYLGLCNVMGTTVLKLSKSLSVVNTGIFRLTAIAQIRKSVLEL